LIPSRRTDVPIKACVPLFYSMPISFIGSFLLNHGRFARKGLLKFPAKVFLSTVGASGKSSKKKVLKDKAVVSPVSKEALNDKPVTSTVSAESFHHVDKKVSNELTWAECLNEIAENKSILVFSKSYCSFCKDVIDRLEDAGLPFKDIALDLRVGGDLTKVSSISGNLKSLTGQIYVPYVFIGKEFVDSEKFLSGIRRQASLDSKNPPLYDYLVSRGLNPTGYFRT
jgi:glutaredoxin 3